MGVNRYGAGALAVALAAVTACATTDVAGEAAQEPSALELVLASDLRAEDAARDEWRHPAETLGFFGIEPGMTVVEANPGGGWYTRVLLPYLGDEGALWASNYAPAMFPNRADDAEFVERLNSFPERFVDSTAEWAPEGLAPEGAFLYGQAPEELKGQADAVLYVRALHGLMRRGGMPMVAEETFEVLKPGGVVGVVQHRAKADADEEWANGQHGYVRESDVIAAFEAAGFEFEDASELNANPADPTDDAGPWRLPPISNGGDPEKAEEYLAIGESDRMTLRFRKPAA